MDLCIECKSSRLVDDNKSIICTECGVVQRINYVNEGYQLDDICYLYEGINSYGWNKNLIGNPRFKSDPLIHMKISEPSVFSSDPANSLLKYKNYYNNLEDVDNIKLPRCNDIIEEHCKKNNIDEQKYREQTTKNYRISDMDSLIIKMDVVNKVISEVHI